MKLLSTLSAVLFASVAMLSLGAQAADTDKTPAAAEMKTEQGAKAVKPHSHVQEKTGMEHMAPAAAPAKKSAAKDKTKHYHPRDMK